MKFKREKENREDKETKKALLNNHTDNNATNNNETKEEKKKRKKSAWSGLLHKLKLLWPFMWPKGDLALQVRVIVCVAIVVATRGVTVLVPIFYGKIVDCLTTQAIPAVQHQDDHNDTKASIAGAGSYNPVTMDTGWTTIGPELSSLLSTESPVMGASQPRFCWDYILIFILMKSLHGGSGYLNCLRSFLWISVSQFTRKKMRLELFTHLHSLSVQWHLQRKTGEVLRVMDRGVNSINLILSHVLFNIAPVIADVLIAIVFFVTVFDVWTGLIVFGTMVGYLVFTIVISEWRTKYRRQMNETDNSRNATSVDSILNFETVKYYSAEDWEVKCYEVAVDKHLKAEWSVNATANLLNCVQRGMMMLGLLGGSLLLAWHVHRGKLTIGDFVLFLSYVEQLYGPLNMFGAYYRTLQQAFVDMENMFEMLEEKVEVKDEPEAPSLVVTRGEITFDNVHFSYNVKRPILRGISFTIPPGHTYALVGHSGGGKSTIIRLLFRFYDIQSGAILIDGQDISKVTQKSLRKQVGVVPQDTVLFNKDIRYNINYGRHDATDEEVENAAKAADIHDRIMTIPDGYSARVGERGLKLSGGEKQRIAIARTILKAPQIVLLDEATSALDTKTERNIQDSLSHVCEGRTTVIVAHRLSTIVHADQILVIEEGQIVEQGTHEELIMDEGLYYEMWHDQLQSGEIETEDACSCCPDGLHQVPTDATDEETEEEEEIEALVERELAEADAIDGAGAGTGVKIAEAGAVGDGEKREGEEQEKSEFKSDNKSDSKLDTKVEFDDFTELPNRNSRVLFSLDGDNKELKIIEEGEDGYVEEKESGEDCKCPCHVQQEVLEDLMAAGNTNALAMFSRQISAQGRSLEDVGVVKEEKEEEFGDVTGPDVLAPLLGDDDGGGGGGGWEGRRSVGFGGRVDGGRFEGLSRGDAVDKDQQIMPVTQDKAIQVKMVSRDNEEEDLDDLFHHVLPPARPNRYASTYNSGGPKSRHIGRTISMSERPRPRLYDRPLSIYDRHRLASSSDGRDRSRTVSTGDELGNSAGASGRGLRRQLTRQQSCLHARCKAKEFRERQISRDRDRDNANRLSVKDHEHFSVSIDDLNAATEQYYRDSEDNSALKTTIVTPTEEGAEQKYPTVADVIKENNRHSLRDSMEVKVDIDPEV